MRAESCTTEVPSRSRLVAEPHQASGVKASTAPRLGGEHGVEAGLLGRGDQFGRIRGRLRTPISQLQSELHLDRLPTRP